LTVVRSDYEVAVTDRGESRLRVEPQLRELGERIVDDLREDLERRFPEVGRVVELHVSEPKDAEASAAGSRTLSPTADYGSGCSSAGASGGGVAAPAAASAASARRSRNDEIASIPTTITSGTR
jgi:hypothetical protein